MIKKIKYISLIVAGSISSLLLLSSCKEDAQPEPNKFAYVSLTHAAVILPTQRPVNVFVDGQRINKAAILSYPNTVTGTYVGIEAGTKSLSIRDTTSASVIEYAAASATVEAGKTYSVFAYDTVLNGKIRTLVLNTNRTDAVAANTSKFRFLHLSPDAPAVDVWAFRSATDSVRLYQNVSYVGATPNATTLSAFIDVPSAAYTIRVRLAGTNTNVASASVTVAPGKFYTGFARGLARLSSGTNALGATVIVHN